MPSQDGEVHDTRHRFDRQLALALALTLTLGLDLALALPLTLALSPLWCPIHCAHESPAVRTLGRSIGERPANLLGLDPFDRLSSRWLVTLAYKWHKCLGRRFFLFAGRCLLFCRLLSRLVRVVVCFVFLMSSVTAIRFVCQPIWAAPGWDFTSTLMATNCRGAQNCSHVSLIWCCR